MQSKLKLACSAYLEIWCYYSGYKKVFCLCTKGRVLVVPGSRCTNSARTLTQFWHGRSTGSGNDKWVLWYNQKSKDVTSGTLRERKACLNVCIFSLSLTTAPTCSLYVFLQPWLTVSWCSSPAVHKGVNDKVLKWLGKSLSNLTPRLNYLLLSQECEWSNEDVFW